MAEGPSVRLSPDPTPDEAAAIATALERLLAEEARAAGDGAAPEGDPWAGRRFAFSGRRAKLTGEAARPPDGAPADPWTAMGRLGRR